MVCSIVQTIAKDQNEVAEKLNDLLSLHGVGSNILSVDTERFGANQFLILVLYKGAYRTLSSPLALVCSVGRAIGIGRDTSLGLTCSVSYVKTP